LAFGSQAVKLLFDEVAEALLRELGGRRKCRRFRLEEKQSFNQISFFATSRALLWRVSRALLPSEEKEDYGTGTPVKRKQEKPCVAGREWVVETLQSSDFAGFKRGGGVKLDFHDRDLQNLLEYTVQSCHVLRREGRKRRNERKEIRRR